MSSRGDPRGALSQQCQLWPCYSPTTTLLLLCTLSLVLDQALWVQTEVGDIVPSFKEWMVFLRESEKLNTNSFAYSTSIT